jgi:hypothetical protein
VRGSFHGPHNIQAFYRACSEKGLLERDRIAPNTFRRVVKQHELLKPDAEVQSKRRLAFAKAHANELWQADTYSVLLNKLPPDSIADFIRAELDKVALSHGTFTDDALGLIVPSSEGGLAQGQKPVPRSGAGGPCATAPRPSTSSTSTASCSCRTGARGRLAVVAAPHR